MVEIVQCVTDKHKADLTKLLVEYIQWAQSFVDADPLEAPTFSEIEKEFANLPDIYAPAHGGGFYLAYRADKLAGCVALKKVDESTCELKRMYVRPEHRGQKIGWLLVQHLLEKARGFAYKKLVLDSHISMKKAHSIYKSAGFKVVPTPDDFPEELKPIVVFMEMEL